MFSICISRIGARKPCVWKVWPKLSAMVVPLPTAADRCRTRYLAHKRFSLHAAHGSASVRDGRLCVTAVNPPPTKTIELEVELHRAQWEGNMETVLLANDIRAYNTFEQPDRMCLDAPQQVQPHGNAARVTLPPGGIVRLQGALG